MITTSIFNQVQQRQQMRGKSKPVYFQGRVPNNAVFWAKDRRARYSSTFVAVRSSRLDWKDEPSATIQLYLAGHPLLAWLVRVIKPRWHPGPWIRRPITSTVRILLRAIVCRFGTFAGACSSASARKELAQLGFSTEAIVVHRCLECVVEG